MLKTGPDRRKRRSRPAIAGRVTLYCRREPESKGALIMTAEDRIAFLRSLRAVRSFRPDPVPQEVVDHILEVARWSGSASNKQPWQIWVVRERDTLRSLAAVEG